MTDLERMVWAAAYAAGFESERRYMDKYGRSIDDISGFSVAERADVAVIALREAMAGDDAKHLLPVKERDGEEGE